MAERKICKFISPYAAEELRTSCFVLETNRDIIRGTYTLKLHRMILCVQGSGVFRIGAQSVPFTSGTIVFAFASESMTAEGEQDIAYIYIDFSGMRAEELFRRFGIGGKNRSFVGFDGLIPLWNESLASASEHNIDLAAESILLYTFSRLSVKILPKNDLISRIVEITDAEFADPALSVASLARRFSYNPKYLSHLFKERMGINYSEYLRSMRIKFAISLFDRGIDSVKNVALLSGFTDPLYFSSVFKKSTGKAPTEYKNGIRP